MTTLELFTAVYPLHQAFNISRGSKSAVRTLVVRLQDEDGHVGYGETVPYARYGEDVDSVAHQIGVLAGNIEHLHNGNLQHVGRPGSARNAVDAALWDLRAKQSGAPVWDLAHVGEREPLLCTHITISLDTPEKMAADAQGLTGILKLKLGGRNADGAHDGLDGERLEAVRGAAPDARLIADVNEGWTLAELMRYGGVLNACRVELLEQPLPESHDEALRNVRLPCPVYADESVHTRVDLKALIGLYQGVCIKLEKTGGLTEALAVRREAERMGFQIMIGCMAGGSLSTAPATLLAQGANWVDLDGPRLVSEDTNPRLRFEGDYLQPLPDNFWGGAEAGKIVIPGLKPVV